MVPSSNPWNGRRWFDMDRGRNSVSDLRKHRRQRYPFDAVKENILKSAFLTHLQKGGKGMTGNFVQYLLSPFAESSCVRSPWACVGRLLIS